LLGGEEYFDRFTQDSEIGANSLLCFNMDDDEAWILNDNVNQTVHRYI
jgi:hypothetical protein